MYRVKMDRSKTSLTGRRKPPCFNLHFALALTPNWTFLNAWNLGYSFHNVHITFFHIISFQEEPYPKGNYLCMDK